MPNDLSRYKDKNTKAFADGEFVKKFASIDPKQLYKKLVLVELAKKLEALNTPGNNLEMLKGNRKGQYSIRANDRWRICFKWSSEQSQAYDIEIVDYH